MNVIWIKEGSKLSELLDYKNEFPKPIESYPKSFWEKHNPGVDYIYESEYKDIKGYIKLK